MTKARDLANAADVLDDVSATELGYVNGVTSAIQTQIDSKEPTLPSQTGNSGKYLTTNGSTKSWGTVSQYSLPSQTGNSGKFLTTNGTSESWGTVNQPTTWTGRYGDATDNFPNTIAHNGSLYVAAGGDGSTSFLITSSNGTTWTPRTSGFGTNAINAVVWDSTNSLWIIAGDNGLISTSPDGITWTSRTANMATNSIKDLATNAGTTVAVGAGGGTTNTGGITYSTNGTTWTRKSQSLTVGSNYNSVVYNGTNWVVGADNSTNNHLYASTPSGTWTAQSTGLSQTCCILFWDGTKHIIRQSNNNNDFLSYSTNVTVGTTTKINNVLTVTAAHTSPKRFVSFYNSRMYIGEDQYNTDMTTTISDTNFIYDIKTRELNPGYRGSATPSVATYKVFAQGKIAWVSGTLYTSF